MMKSDFMQVFLCNLGVHFWVYGGKNLFVVNPQPD